MNKNATQSDAFIEAMELLLRYKWRFLLTGFLVMIAILGGSLVLPRKYQATAIFDRRTDMVLAEIMTHGGPRTFQDPRQSLVKEIVGQPTIDHLINELENGDHGIDFSYVDTRVLRTELSRQVLIDFEIASANLDRIKVSYTSADPQLARFVVNELVRGYITLNRTQTDMRLRESTQFFREQAELAKATVEDIASRKLAFEIKHGDKLPDSSNSVQTVKAMAELSLSQAAQKRDALEMKVDAIRDRLFQTPESTQAIITQKNPELERLETRLRELESQRALYVSVYKMTQKHPDLIAIDEEIAAALENIKGTETEVVTQKRFAANPMRAELELQLSTNSSEFEALNRHIEGLQARVAGIGENSAEMFPIRAEYERLVRELDQATRQIDFWEKNQNRVQMSLSAESDNRGIRLDFIKPCDYIRKPISPNLAQVLLATIGLGIFCGGLSIFFANRSDTSFNTTHELSETLHLPVVGAVSEIIGEQQRKIRALKNTVVYPLNVAGMIGVLAIMAGLLYTSLERPHYFDDTSPETRDVTPNASPGQPAAHHKAIPDFRDPKAPVVQRDEQTPDDKSLKPAA